MIHSHAPGYWTCQWHIRIQCFFGHNAVKSCQVTRRFEPGRFHEQEDSFRCCLIYSLSSRVGLTGQASFTSDFKRRVGA